MEEWPNQYGDEDFWDMLGRDNQERDPDKPIYPDLEALNRQIREAKQSPDSLDGIVGSIQDSASSLDSYANIMNNAARLDSNNTNIINALGKKSRDVREAWLANYGAKLKEVESKMPGSALSEISHLKSSIMAGSLHDRYKLEVAYAVHFNSEEAKFPERIRRYVHKGEKNYVLKHRDKFSKQLGLLSQSFGNLENTLNRILEVGIDLHTYTVLAGDEIIEASFNDVVEWSIGYVRKLKHDIDFRKEYLDKGITLNFTDKMTNITHDFISLYRMYNSALDWVDEGSQPMADAAHSLDRLMRRFIVMTDYLAPTNFRHDFHVFEEKPLDLKLYRSVDI